MFGKLTYLIYTLIFTVPLITFLWWRHYIILRRCLPVIGAITTLALAYCILVWPLGLTWGCWSYAGDRILGLRILGVDLEDLVWFACIAWLYGSFAVVSSEYEEAGKPLIRGILLGTRRRLPPGT